MEFRVTDWDSAFHKLRKEYQDEYDSLESLFARLKEDANDATKVVKTDLRLDWLDARLAHLLEAKNSILARWRTQRLNRRLRKKIAELNREIEAYYIELSNQQWNEVRSSVDGQMRVGGKWNLLKSLLDESQSKGNQRLAIDRIVHSQEAKGVSEKALPAEGNYNSSAPHNTSSPEADDYAGNNFNSAKRNSRTSAKRNSQISAKRTSQISAKRNSRTSAKRNSQISAKRNSQISAKRTSQISAKRNSRTSAKRNS
ncbi:hypothetical protein MTO96_043411 [Rhipicephalus appendiculatus]